MEIPSDQPIIVQGARHIRAKRGLLAFFLFIDIIILDTLLIYSVLAHTTNSLNSQIFTILPFNLIVLWVLWISVLNRDMGTQGCPLLIINDQGIILRSWQFRDYVQIPWEEIAQIEYRRTCITYFTIHLRNPAHWWATYGNNRYRNFWLNPTTQTHFHFRQFYLAVPVHYLLFDIYQKYQEQLASSKISIKYPLPISRFRQRT